MFCMTMSTCTDVVILGGGVAGLSAAKALRENGIDDYILLEGSDRLGGRVHSTKTEEGHVLELGAAWIHGADLFPLYDLAVGAKAKLHQTRLELATARDEQGNNVTDGFRAAYDQLTTHCEASCEIADEMRTFLDKHDMPHQKALEHCGWKAQTVEEKGAEYLVYDYYYGMDNNLISTRFSFEYDPNDPGSADLRVVDPCGFQGLIQCICDVDDMENPGDQRVLLNQVVVEVIHSDDGVVVRTADGTSFSARYAIMTFSLGVLKSNAVTFTPPLPTEKQQCIQELVMLNYMKVFVAFDEDIEPFWDCSEMIVYCSERKHYFTVWENQKVCGANILVGTLMDREADASLSWSTQEVTKNAMAVLRSMYGHLIPEPKWVKTTTWATNPLFYGSFSGRPVGFSLDRMEMFKAPVGRLHFAGEACSTYSYGDVYGAYETGSEEGATVAKLCGGKFKPMLHG